MRIGSFNPLYIEAEFCVDDGVAHGASKLKVGYGNTLLWATDAESAEKAKLLGMIKETSCNIGQELCPFLHNHGCKWTIGNDAPMYLVSGPNDEVKSFLLPEIESVFWLHDRFHTFVETKATEFYAKLLQLYDQEISRWGSSSVAYYLNINKSHRKLWDSGFVLKKEKPSPPPPPPPPPKKKYRFVGKVMKDTTGYVYIGRIKLPVYLYTQGTNVEGEAEEV